MISYHLDPNRIPLERVKGEILGRKLSEKRKILAAEAEARFGLMRRLGILTLGDLIEATRTKKALTNFQSKTGFPEEYTVVLRREALGYLPQPVDLKRIPGVDSQASSALTQVGLTDSRKVWERLVSDSASLGAVAGETGIEARVLRELFEMSDLARRLKEVNAGNRYTKVTATTADLAACIGWARELSADT